MPRISESGPGGNVHALSREGLALHRAGRREEARLLYERALQLDARHWPALYGLGLLATEARDPGRAIQWLRRALSIRPDDPQAHGNLAVALRAMGRIEEALASFDRAIALEPGLPELPFNRGICRFEIGRVAEALQDFDQAVLLRPRHAEAWYHRALALRAEGRNEAAIESYRRAIDLKPDFAQAHNNLGNLLNRLGDPEAAERSLARAVALLPASAAFQTSYGVALLALRRFEHALTCFDRAIALAPALAEAHGNRGLALAALQRYEAALESFERATALDPRAPEAYLNQANVLRETRRYGAAVERLDRALERMQRPSFARGMRVHLKMQICDWEAVGADLAALAEEIERGEPVCPPFPTLAFSESPALQRRAAEIWVREQCPPNPGLGPIAPRPRAERLRIGYFSADFREHSVSILTAELFETHDRSRFEPIAFSYGPDTGDVTRRRLERAFDRFLDVRSLGDRQIADLSRRLEVDIAIDLGGFTQGARPGIFALRAAPIQLGYLGYLGTTGAPYMDYLVADPLIVPEHLRGHYSEKILNLPTYQVNDSSRAIAERVFTRAELKLPESGFVFCCFNANYKITPETFGSWMRILRRVEGSVLFLFAGSEPVEANLRREAVRRGIDPKRLVFGEWLPPAEYRARYRAADLFLDTLPYNAGTTASDALWAGLPVLTLAGETFASRIAASLLSAIGMPELVATSRVQYEELAVSLASRPETLSGLRKALAQKRDSAALFDTRQFVEALETGYLRIYERSLAGLPPAHQVIEPARGPR